MAANVPRSQPATNNSGARAVLAKEPAARRPDPSSPPGAVVNPPRRPSGYGLPCSKCHLYYSADLDVCPTCKHNQRVSVVVPKTPSRASQTEPSPTPDSATIEREREEFLRQFRAQLLEAHSENADSTKSACKVPEHRSGQPAIAEVCAACYSRLQESLDLCQSALQLDPKEAAQIVYDAVWADPSDPGRTYQNAANALLAELRKRAGMNTPLDPL